MTIGDMPETSRDSVLRAGGVHLEPFNPILPT
jgi:hypothetical protein